MFPFIQKFLREDILSPTVTTREPQSRVNTLVPCASEQNVRNLYQGTVHRMAALNTRICLTRQRRIAPYIYTDYGCSMICIVPATLEEEIFKKIWRHRYGSKCPLRYEMHQWACVSWHDYLWLRSTVPNSSDVTIPIWLRSEDSPSRIKCTKSKIACLIINPLCDGLVPMPHVSEMRNIATESTVTTMWWVNNDQHRA